MKLLKNKNTLIFLILNLSVLIISLVYNFLFKERLISECVFLNTFGFYCPGCGGSRSLNALLSFNLYKSFIYYPPILITSLILIYVDIKLIYSAFKLRDKAHINPSVFLIIPIAIILNFVIRNILLFSGIDVLGNVL